MIGYNVSDLLQVEFWVWYFILVHAFLLKCAQFLKVAPHGGLWSHEPWTAKFKCLLWLSWSMKATVNIWISRFMVHETKAHRVVSPLERWSFANEVPFLHRLVIEFHLTTCVSATLLLQMLILKNWHELEICGCKLKWKHIPCRRRNVPSCA